MVSFKPRWVVSLCLSLIFFSSLPAVANNLRILTGKASVIEAHTLQVDGKVIRLKWIRTLPVYRPATRRSPVPFFDIQAESSVKPAVYALKRQIGNETVTCEVEVHKRLDLFKPQESFSGICYLGDSTRGLDLNGWLVRHGWARVDRLGSVKRYVQEEAKAKTEQAGAWSLRREYRWCCQGVNSEMKYRLRFPSGLD